jgi:hypothetical protein
MADLKNSQRITYKATYNQISPTATIRSDGNSPTKSLSRAVELHFPPDPALLSIQMITLIDLFRLSQ